MDTYAIPTGAQEAGGEAAPEIQEDVRRAVVALYTRARNHVDDEVGPKLARVWRYYDGEVDSPPAYEVGRDEAGNIVYHGNATVVREVWDKIQAVLPELARVFLGSSESVAYQAKKPGQDAFAEQATDYANYVFRVENNGEEQSLESFVAWLIKFCAWKVYQVSETVEEHAKVRLTEDGLFLLQQEMDAPDSNVTAFDAVPVVETEMQTVPGPDGQPTQQSVPYVTYDVSITRERKQGHICIELIPQDEFIIDPDAMSVEEALFVGQDCMRTVSSVVALGVPYETVKEHAGTSGASVNNTDAATARRGRTNDQQIGSDTGLPALDYVRVIEAIAQLDTDGDGIAERRRVLLLGDGPELIDIGPGNDCYYIVGSPFRRPHEPIGQGVGEAVMDIQDSKTAAVRGLYNSINKSLTPRVVISETDDTAYADLKSPLGPYGSGIVRSSSPAGVAFHVTPFTGEKMYPLLEFLDNLSATRTGITPAGQGLDADILKGTTIDGTKLVANSAQNRIEFLIREYAVVMRELFRAILKLATTFPDKAKTVRLRGEWVEVDPSLWDGDMDVDIRVGLGTGTRQERMAGIMAISAKQQEAKLTGSPLVGVREEEASMRALCELVGYRDSGRFFKEMSDQELQQAQEQAQQAQKQAAAEAAQMAAMVEGAKAAQKAEVDGKVEVAKAQLTAQQHEIDKRAEAQQAQLDAQAKEAQSARDHARAEAENQRQHAAKLAAIEAQERATLDKQQRDFALKLKELELESALEKERMKNNVPSGNANIRQAESV